MPAGVYRWMEDNHTISLTLLSDNTYLIEERRFAGVSVAKDGSEVWVTFEESGTWSYQELILTLEPRWDSEEDQRRPEVLGDTRVFRKVSDGVSILFVSLNSESDFAVRLDTPTIQPNQSSRPTRLAPRA